MEEQRKKSKEEVVSLVNSETYAGEAVPLNYGVLQFDWVSRINEMFGNQTLISPPKGFLEVHGGNVAVTIHGFLRDRNPAAGGFLNSMNRKQQKNMIELMRNIQGTMAHIPMRIIDLVPDPTGLNPIRKILELIFGDTGIGQLALWTFTIIPFTGWLSSEMVFHTNMVIKSMEFEHSAQYADEYAYTISFEKISLGLVQYVVDLIVNMVTGITIIPKNRLSSVPRDDGSVSRGGGHDYVTNNKMFTGVNDVLVNINSLTNQQFVDDLADSVAPFDPTGQLIDGQSQLQPVSDVNGVGTTSGGLTRIITLSQDGQMSAITTVSDDGYANRPNKYKITPRIDTTLEWKRIPFQNALPHSFVFTLGNNNYKMEWKALVTINDEDTPSYYLHLTLTKNNEVIYIGKIIEGVQFTFDGDLNVVLNTFKLFVDEDKSLNVTLGGIIASG